jgi:hypothetical protein
MTRQVKTKKKKTVAASERRRLPELERTEPIRSWSTLFGQSSSGGGQGFASATDAVQRGVELGYRVIDDYVRQGAAVAGSFANGATPLPTAGQDLSLMTDRMLKYASDFASVWFDAMGLLIASRNGASAGQSAGTVPPPRATGGHGTNLSLQVTAEVPVEVRLTLDSTQVPGSGLVIESLRDIKGRAVLDDISVDVPSDPTTPLQVKLTVPKRTTSGRYTGAILDATTKNPRGRLTLIVAK